MKLCISRDEEAVSSAVATVLLFGGVVSIIGLMIVSMVPIIEELEGSIERGDMSAQMLILAEQTESLSERGMPGDSTEVELIPLDGTMSWDLNRGGMWYSATWQNESSFRMKGVMDYDDLIEIKHPESITSAICFDDMRLGPSRPYIYTTPQWAESAQIAVSTGLAIPLGPVQVKVIENEQTKQNLELQIYDSLTVDLSSMSNSIIESSHDLIILYTRGDGGATIITPSSADPSDKTGRSWNIPLTTGTSRIHIVSESSNQINIESSTDSSTHYAIHNDQYRVGVTHSQEITLTQPDVIKISTSANSQLLLQTNLDNKSGTVSWLSTDGNYLGHEFIAPSLPGEMEFTNPSTDSVTVTWRGGGTSVPANGNSFVAWPPAGINGAPILDSDGDLFVSWSVIDSGLKSNGIKLIPASDTGSSSGSLHSVNIPDDGLSHSLLLSRAGISSTWNITGDIELENTLDKVTHQSQQALSSGSYDLKVLQGHPIKAYLMSGNDGLNQAKHDGLERCISINMMASGWIAVELPWDSLSGRDDSRLIDAWKSGDHPASLKITLIGHHEGSTHSILATSWVFHLSRLAYTFSSSITGMEVAYSGGAVVTNHPEFTPTIVREPVDRSGPGPRFAATIPSLHPISESTIGGGRMVLDIELSSRVSLASSLAYEVRRGWSEPYGGAIATDASDGLDLSEDWTIYPGRLDLLRDYVGWVPDPSIGTSEAVWHTSGEPIQFSLQLSSLDVDMMEAIG
jgi:hypothetical protein